MKEIYKDVLNYEGFYQVSNLGNVKSLSRKAKSSYGRFRPIQERIRKTLVDTNGYLRVSLSKEGNLKNKKVHRLVAETFLKDAHKKGLVVDHIDNVKTNNREDNLQWITHRKNSSKDKKNTTSKYTGVSKNQKCNGWYARIRINGKQKYLGSFSNELEASKAYQRELKKIRC